MRELLLVDIPGCLLHSLLVFLEFEVVEEISSFRVVENPTSTIWRLSDGPVSNARAARALDTVSDWYVPLDDEAMDWGLNWNGEAASSSTGEEYMVELTCSCINPGSDNSSDSKGAPLYCHSLISLCSATLRTSKSPNES